MLFISTNLRCVLVAVFLAVTPYFDGGVLDDGACLLLQKQANTYFMIGGGAVPGQREAEPDKVQQQGEHCLLMLARPPHICGMLQNANCVYCCSERSPHPRPLRPLWLQATLAWRAPPRFT
jgi:hypothetical protein